ncbi:MAG: hypothetical protein QM767_22750 [Anaeromyxobacter sp.]
MNADSALVTAGLLWWLAHGLAWWWLARRLADPEEASRDGEERKVRRGLRWLLALALSLGVPVGIPTAIVLVWGLDPGVVDPAVMGAAFGAVIMLIPLVDLAREARRMEDQRLAGEPVDPSCSIWVSSGTTGLAVPWWWPQDRLDWIALLALASAWLVSWRVGITVLCAAAWACTMWLLMLEARRRPPERWRRPRRGKVRGP